MKRLIFVAAALTLAGCSRSNPTVTPSLSPSPVGNPSNSASQIGKYPPEAITSFMQGCTAGQPPSMNKNCSCMIQQIQSTYTYEQYQSIVQSGISTAPGIQQIISDCADNPSTVFAPPPAAPMEQSGNVQTYIKGQDGQFLGVVSNNQVAEKSICNQVGAFGSQVSPTSIRSQVSNYGSQISDFSAYNPNAQKPPLLIQNGQPTRLLTKNHQLQGGLDPDELFLSACGR